LIFIFYSGRTSKQPFSLRTWKRFSLGSASTQFVLTVMVCVWFGSDKLLIHVLRVVQFRVEASSFESDVVLCSTCLSYHSNIEAVLFVCPSSGWPPQREDCLPPRWETALSVFPKNIAMRYRIGSRTIGRQTLDNRHANRTDSALCVGVVKQIQRIMVS